MSSSVEQIKSRLNIVDVVQSYIKLQKAGANMKARCPFHSEKTPSFVVSPPRDSFHCFGCGKSGDIFSFVMEIEGLEFVEALKLLANKAGVELEPIDPKQKTERDRLMQIMEESRNFYQTELKKNKAVGDYLKERGMKGEAALSFNVGYVSDGWRNLYDHLSSRGYKDGEMEKAGLIIKKQAINGSKDSAYDRFRNRIMFPLSTPSGQIVGFTGRIFGDGEDALKGGKYVNTPQTVLYDKSKTLYGFDKAKHEIRKKDFCILVEGQMDVIMSHQAGIVNTVAVSGTALTREHLKTIQRLTENLVIAFDKDDAGIVAAGRGIDLALAEGFEIKVAIIPSGKDPADTIKEDPKEWEKAINNTKNIIEFYIDLFEKRKDIEKKVLPYIVILPSEMEKAQWVKKIANKLNIKEESVWEELKKTKKPNFEEATPEGNDEPSPKAVTPKRHQLLKDRIIGFALWKKDTKEKDFKKFIDKAIKEKDINYGDMLDAEKERLIFETELFYTESNADPKEEFTKLVSELKKEETKEELLIISNKIKKLELAGDKVELDKNLEKFYKLSKELNELN